MKLGEQIGKKVWDGLGLPDRLFAPEDDTDLDDDSDDSDEESERGGDKGPGVLTVDGNPVDWGALYPTGREYPALLSATPYNPAGSVSGGGGEAEQDVSRGDAVVIQKQTRAEVAKWAALERTANEALSKLLSGTARPHSNPLPSANEPV
jgi:hypothetical protein